MFLISVSTNSFMNNMYSSFTPNLATATTKTRRHYEITSLHQRRVLALYSSDQEIEFYMPIFIHIHVHVHVHACCSMECTCTRSVHIGTNACVHAIAHTHTCVAWYVMFLTQICISPRKIGEVLDHLGHQRQLSRHLLRGILCRGTHRKC